MASFVRKPPPSGGAVGGGSGPDDSKFADKFPALWEYLTLRQHDDGAPRETSTMLVFVEGGQWKCCVNDRDAGMSAFVSASTFEGLMKAVEEALKQGKADWRVPRSQRRR